MHRRDLFSRTGTHSGTTSITNGPAACDRDRTAESRGPIGPRQACLTTAATRLCGSGFGERRRSGSELFPPPHTPLTRTHTGRTGTCTSRASYVPLSLAGVEYRSRVTSCSRSDRSGYCVCPVPTLQPGLTDQSHPTSNFSLFSVRCPAEFLSRNLAPAGPTIQLFSAAPSTDRTHATRNSRRTRTNDRGQAYAPVSRA